MILPELNEIKQCIEQNFNNIRLPTHITIELHTTGLGKLSMFRYWNSNTGASVCLNYCRSTVFFGSELEYTLSLNYKDIINENTLNQEELFQYYIQTPKEHIYAADLYNFIKTFISTS